MKTNASPSAIALLALACVSACSAGKDDGGPGQPLDGGLGDASGGTDTRRDDAVMLDTDPGFTIDGEIGTDAGDLERVSSLALEQVWFITGSFGSSEMLVDFRVKPPLVTCGGVVGSTDGFEGTGVFTDPKTGDLLFYTDGRKVFNGKDNALLDNGDLLNGDSSACEPALITPLDDKGKFYIFTNDTNVGSPSGVWYSTIDLTVGPHGTVLKKNQPVTKGNPGEALDIVPHKNGSDFWLLTYEGAASVRAYLVNASGVSATPVVSSTGLTGSVKRAAINHTYDYDHLALAMNFGGTTGLIATADIDRATGMVSGTKTRVTGDLGYHASFSEDGTKLYYVRGTEGWQGIAYQYDLTAGVDTMLGGTGMAAAKLAPDGKVYWAANAKGSMGVVAEPNKAGTACGFVESGLSLKGCTVAFGVPNQTASYLQYLPEKPR
ncbi:MAG: hypothetical protein ABI175_19430 [Polyangiales bacterium]